MKIQIKNRYNGAVLYSCEIQDTGCKNENLGLAVIEAVKNNVDLMGADLMGVDLDGAKLTNAKLRDADLEGAKLKGAYLEGADLKGADLEDAILVDANLKGVSLIGTYLGGAILIDANLEGAILTNAILVDADLEDANLENASLENASLIGTYLGGANLENVNLKGANLEPIKQDMFDVLRHAIPEMPMLKDAIIKGKINGSVYEGECACLVGTLEKSERFHSLNLDIIDSSRPIERFFLAIKKGDTPENNQASAIVLSWIEEFEKTKGE